MKIKITEQQRLKIENILKENGMVIVDKDTDVNAIKKYTDKDIKVAVVDDEEKSINEYRQNNTFNFDEFKLIKTLNDRITYCKQNLKEVGKGSSRIVFDIDGKYVLKVAINESGFKQNKTEYMQDNKNPLLAKCVDVDKKGSLISAVIMEKAQSINENEFKKLTGVDFNDMVKVGDIATSSDEFFSEINRKYKNQNAFLKELENFVSDSGIGRGLADFLVLTSYGKVTRDGKTRIVLIDYGYSEESVHDYHGGGKSKVQSDDDIERMISRMGQEDQFDDF